MERWFAVVAGARRSPTRQCLLSGDKRKTCSQRVFRIDPGCVKTPTRGECAELFSIFSSFDVRARAVFFLFNVIETNVLRESSALEFSHSLDPKRTSSE
jgi:hypothetical protein